MGSLGFLLPNLDFFLHDPLMIGDIGDGQPKQVGGPEHGVDSHIQQRQVPQLAFGPKERPNDLEGFLRKGIHLPHGFSSVPRPQFKFGFTG